MKQNRLKRLNAARSEIQFLSQETAAADAPMQMRCSTLMELLDAAIAEANALPEDES